MSTWTELLNNAMYQPTAPGIDVNSTRPVDPDTRALQIHDAAAAGRNAAVNTIFNVGNKDYKSLSDDPVLSKLSPSDRQQILALMPRVFSNLTNDKPPSKNVSEIPAFTGPTPVQQGNFVMSDRLPSSPISYQSSTPDDFVLNDVRNKSYGHMLQVMMGAETPLPHEEGALKFTTDQIKQRTQADLYQRNQPGPSSTSL